MKRQVQRGTFIHISGAKVKDVHKYICSFKCSGKEELRILMSINRLTMILYVSNNKAEIRISPKEARASVLKRGRGLETINSNFGCVKFKVGLYKGCVK